MSPPVLLLRDVDLDGHRVHLVVRDGIVDQLGGTIDLPSEAVVVDGQGGAILPGLHDHHIHLLALAASLDSVAVGPRDVHDLKGLRAALVSAAGSRPPAEWIRGVGYHDSVAGPLDRFALDAVVADRPVRIQHRSGTLWVLNSVALEQVGLLRGPGPEGCEVGVDGTPNGRLFRLDRWLADRLPHRPPDLASVGRLLAARGVTGVTDATPYASVDQLGSLARAASDGSLPQRVIVTGGPSLDAASIPLPLAAGPAKLLLPDHDLPTPDAVATLIEEARARHRAVAVHCVTRVSLVVTLAALRQVGTVAGDRIEHGAVVPPELRADLAELGLTVVTQPNFVAERGDEYLAEVEPEDLPHLWPCRSLVDAGIAVAGGTDAPFGRPDPWRLVAAAVARRTPSGVLLGADERLEPTGALDLLLRPGERPAGPVRRVAVGHRADLCVLDTSLAEALAAPDQVQVRHTVIAGRLLPTTG